MTINPKHITMVELESGSDAIRQSSKDRGLVEMIVRRPNVGEREIVELAELDPLAGLVGDNWRIRGSSQTADGSPHPDMQLTMMNSRVIALLAKNKARWPLAGDQLYVNMDLSVENLPTGSQLVIGSAMIEITDQPHSGCKQFATRFGLDAVKFVNSLLGKKLRLRGVNAKVIQHGVIRVGDAVKKT